MASKSGTPPIFDAHLDVISLIIQGSVYRPFHEVTDGPVSLRKLMEGNIRIIVSPIHCRDIYNGPGTASAYLEAILRYADNALTGLKPVRTSCDLNACFASSSCCGVLFSLKNADALLDTGVDFLERRSIKVVSLTYRGRNRIGDGSEVFDPHGLTKAGKGLARKLESRGFAIDVSHLSAPSFWDVLNDFNGPLLASHMGLHSCCPRDRNLGDSQLDALFQRDGMVGISMNPEALSLNSIATANDIFCHVDRVVQKHGAHRVGIGSEFCAFEGINQTVKDVSELGELAEVFSQRGYSDEAIAGILGDNWRRFYASLLDRSSN